MEIFFSKIGKVSLENKNYFFIVLGILIGILVVVSGTNVLVKSTKKRKNKDMNKLKSIPGTLVYGSDGKKIGKVKDIYLEDNRIYGWFIIVDKKLSKKIKIKKILVKHKYVKSISHIMIIDEDILNNIKRLKNEKI